jgi:hypothetical protein
MDLLSKWNPWMREETAPPAHDPANSIPEMIREFTGHYMSLWWSRERTPPSFNTTFATQKQAENEKNLEKLADGLIDELKKAPRLAEERRAWIAQLRTRLEPRLKPQLASFVRDALNLQQRHLDFIESSGMANALLEFASKARRFDPVISAEDIYQAGRNVMTANFIQVLLGLPVEVTPSVFAYSMLYPYTDNYLDDPAVSRTTKLAFNHRFQRRLMGEAVHPANPAETTICKLVEMIEGEWERSRYPEVYQSLLAIHAAQARSLGLVVPGASPFELDVLGVSFEKGGASVLADGYLVAGWLTADQARFIFGYGAFTQLIDDLEDIEPDLKASRISIFSQTANHWPLDALTNRLIHFGRAINRDLSIFPAPGAAVLEDLFDRSIDPILIDTIARSGKFFNNEYLRELERHMPFRFAHLRKLRKKLSIQKVSLGSLIELALSSNDVP